MTRLLASIGLCLALAAPALAECALNPREAPAQSVFYPAIVRGPATPEEVRTQTAIAVAKTGAPVSPAYLNLPRIVAFFEAGGTRHQTIAAVLSGPLPAPGDKVRLASRHRDPSLPCAFIPWTVVAPGSVASRD